MLFLASHYAPSMCESDIDVHPWPSSKWFRSCVVPAWSLDVHCSNATLVFPAHCAGLAEHSDKDALHQKAEEVRREEALKDYQERKQRVKEVYMLAHSTSARPMCWTADFSMVTKL